MSCWLGLRQKMAFLTQTMAWFWPELVVSVLSVMSLLSVMSTTWLLWPLGYRMGFIVTRKVPGQNGHASVPVGQMVLVLLLAACVLLMPHEVPFMWGGVAAGLTAGLTLASTLYTNRMFLPGQARTCPDIRRACP